MLPLTMTQYDAMLLCIIGVLDMLRVYDRGDTSLFDSMFTVPNGVDVTLQLLMYNIGRYLGIRDITDIENIGITIITCLAEDSGHYDELCDVNGIPNGIYRVAILDGYNSV